MKDLYQRVGNSVLQVGKNIIIEQRQKSFKKGKSSSWAGKNSFLAEILHDSKSTNQQLNYAMNLLKRAFRKDIQSLKNQARYKQLQQEQQENVYSPEL